MNWTDFLGGFSILISLIVAWRGFKKTGAEVQDLTGGTYVKYQEALDRAQENYDELYTALRKEVKALQSEVEQLKLANRDLNTHNRALTRQLVGAKIVPVTLEQAKQDTGD